MMLLMITAGGTLQPSYTFTNQMKSKVTFFIRKKPEAVTISNFRDVLLFGDMGCKPVEELAVLVEQVYAPLLCNKQNHLGWPHVVSEDVINHVLAFKNTVYQVTHF